MLSFLGEEEVWQALQEIARMSDDGQSAGAGSDASGDAPSPSLEIEYDADFVNTEGYVIGASEIGTILGRSPYSTPYRLFQAKLAGEGIPESLPMVIGKWAEEGVLRYFCKTELNTEFDDTSYQVRFHGDVFRATVDYIGPAYDGQGRAIYECKVSMRRGVEEMYYYQLQVQMYLSGIHKGYLLKVINNQRFLVKPVEYNPELVERVLRPAARAFVHALSKRDYRIYDEFLRRAALESRDVRYILPNISDAQVSHAIEQLDSLDMQIEELLEQRREVMDQVMAMMRARGLRVMTIPTRTQRRHRVVTELDGKLYY